MFSSKNRLLLKHHQQEIESEFCFIELNVETERGEKERMRKVNIEHIRLTV